MKVPENEDEETGEARAQEPMSSRKGESGGIGRGGCTLLLRQDGQENTTSERAFHCVETFEKVQEDILVRKVLLVTSRIL